jgi:hypothetical protein
LQLRQSGIGQFALPGIDHVVRKYLDAAEKSRQDDVSPTGLSVVVQFEIHRVAIGFGLWETIGMKKPELEVTESNGPVPLAGTCTSCPSERFHVRVPDNLDAKQALKSLRFQFERHVEQTHRIVRDRSKDKTVEVPRRAAIVGKKRRDQIDARKVRDRGTKA